MLFRGSNEGVKYLPVLIIPGFMSSGLEVVASDVKQGWVGQRIWLNLRALGFEALNRTKNTSVRLSRLETEREADSGRTGILTVEQRESAVLRNAWLHHMALEDDLTTERPGVQVRPIQGLEGVDYLAPGLFTSHVSYVFAPVIEALEKAGYEKGVNLDAAPYDWRLAPITLETRDQYFTRTLDQIEKMYNKNEQTPVVLIGHSMGCKIAHYLLNFAKQARGQDWIDQYVHTYLPIGAPHLGAPKTLRSLISGDKMGLDTFLTDTDALVLGRSLGSAPFLLPTRLPPDAAASAFVRMDGAVEVTVTSSIDVETFLKRRETNHIPQKLKLTVVFAGESCSTPYHYIDQESQQVKFHETFTFRTASYGPKKKQALAILVCEPGSRGARKSDTRTRRCHLKSRACFFRPWKCLIGGKEARWGLPPKDNKVLYWLNIVTFWWLSK